MSNVSISTCNLNAPCIASEVDRYREYVRQRLQRVPVQYITGVAAFRHLELTVTPAVLIPAP